MTRFLIRLPILFSLLLASSSHAENKTQAELDKALGYAAALYKSSPSFKDISKLLDQGANPLSITKMNGATVFEVRSFLTSFRGYRFTHLFLAHIEKDKEHTRQFLARIKHQGLDYAYQKLSRYDGVLESDFVERDSDDPLYLKEYEDYRKRTFFEKKANALDSHNQLALLLHFIKHHTVAGFKPISLDKPEAKTLPRNSGNEKSKEKTHSKK